MEDINKERLKRERMDNLQYVQATHSTMMAPNYIFLTAEFETLLSTNHNPFIKPAAVNEVDVQCTSRLHRIKYN